MGLLDFDVVNVTNSSLQENSWDSVILICENLDWESPSNAFSHFKPAIHDAMKVINVIDN